MASATQHDTVPMAVIDSGLGGLSVVRALRAQQPDISLIYVADTAVFPYGNRDAPTIAKRAVMLVQALQEQHAVRTVVLACNTLSTLALAELRTRFSQLAFVGTVPAIKVAAAQSRSRRFTLLATPNTAQSSYSAALIAEFAADCVVDGYGAPNLARWCEQALLGEPVDDPAWRAELAPAFQNDARGTTDAVVLGCTHYPLLLPTLETLAPWPVRWIDSSAAIARQALRQPTMEGSSRVYVTAPADMSRYQPLFTREGFAWTETLAVAAPRATSA